ncbi:MAG: pyridoxamine 5'-phosphate oxidase family protein [Cyanobacteria bacterium J06648_16]
MSEFERVVELYNAFPQQFRSIVLSTVTDHGQPHASYAPFVMDLSKNVYIFISGLSAHTANLKGRGQASVLFIEDESKTEQIFARRRLAYDCSAQVIARDDGQWGAIATQFEDRFGNIIDVLKGLADFEIFQLRPESGRFVVGFGAAYRISGENLDTLEPVTGSK